MTALQRLVRAECVSFLQRKASRFPPSKSITTIADIVGICRYFEELHPEPRLMGRTAEEKALAESWQRRTERDGFYAAMEAFRNSTPGLKGHALPGPDTYEQIPALAERGRARIQHFFSWLDARLSDNEFICGPHFTIADITGMGHRRLLWLDKAHGAGALDASTPLAFGGFSAS